MISWSVKTVILTFALWAFDQLISENSCKSFPLQKYWMILTFALWAFDSDSFELQNIFLWLFYAGVRTSSSIIHDYAKKIIISWVVISMNTCTGLKNMVKDNIRVPKTSILKLLSIVYVFITCWLFNQSLICMFQPTI